MFGRRRTPATDDTGRGPGWFAAAALIGLVVIALVGVLIVIATREDEPAGSGPAAAPQTTTTAPLPTAASPAIDGDGDDRPEGCETTGTDQTIPTDTPAGINWTLVKGLAVPSSPTEGPVLRGDAGVGYCYSQTPLGVVLAVSNLGRGTGTGQELQEAQLEHSIVPGELANEVRASPPPPEDPAATAGLQIAGFQIISYTPESASVALALTTTARPGTYIIATAAMQWYEGDWRAVVQPGPSVVATSTTTNSLAGYVAWSGVA